MREITLDRDELATFLGDETCFRVLGREALAELAAKVEPLQVDGGEEVMHQGDAADAMYVIHRGRLRAVVEDPEPAVLGESGRGELVGEMALISDRPRTATVIAVRDGELLRLSTDAFTEVVRDHPEALRGITSQVVDRVVSSRSSKWKSPAAALVIAPLTDAPELTQFGLDLVAALRRLLGDVATVDPAGTAERLGHSVADESPADLSGHLTPWCEELEASSGAVVYLADPEPTPWTRFCLRQSDVIVLVGRGGGRPDRSAVEDAVDERLAVVRCPVELVLVHPRSADTPTRTRHWLESRQVARHHHVRQGDQDHTDRVARLLTGRGIGLVLSGGGARGMAEVGVLRALREKGVPVDAVGGTSAGAMVAGTIARGWDTDEITRRLRAAVVEGPNPFDPTLPMVSLAAGRRITEGLREAGGGLDLEDCWLNSYAVSTNLSRGEPEVHRRGPAWRAVRASMSIPGVFPPVADDGDVLVDGGLVDNLPIATMRETHAGIYVIAVDVGVQRELTAGDLPESAILSGWKVIADRLDPRRATPDVLGIVRLLARLTELGGGQKREDVGDFLISPPVERFPILDFSKFDDIVAAGYQEGSTAIRKWLESGAAPAF